MSSMMIFGLGYSACRIASALAERGWSVLATGRSGNMDFADEGTIREALAASSHVLSSVPPDKDGSDPVLIRYGDALRQDWIGYLSSTGVYGDAQGAWVDESSPTGTGRRSARAQCDADWLARGARIFRLPGIYGPGRSALDRVREGKANRIALSGQVFSRVHVDDIVSGVLAALDGPRGAYNLSDDLPCSQNEVIEEACRLIGMEPPELKSLEEAELSPMARAFYAENRRVANGKAKRILGWQPRHADFRAGLRTIADMENRK